MLQLENGKNVGEWEKEWENGVLINFRDWKNSKNFLTHEQV